MSGLTDRLRQVAGQATPGPWRLDNYEELAGDGVKTEAGGWVIEPPIPYENIGLRKRDTSYLATFDPVLVGLMLDVIDAAEASVYEDDDATYVALRDVLARFREVAG